jgi:hypothetical protein
MVNTNVYFQDMVIQMQCLIKFDKDNWGLADYPVEDHSLVRHRAGQVSISGFTNSLKKA